MPTTRRDFIRFFGATLAAWLAGCVPTSLPGGGPGATSTRRPPGWAELRSAWLGLSYGDPAEHENRRKNHRAALDELVAAGALKPEVAEQMQLAFDEAVRFYETPPVPTCYVPTMAPQPTETPPGWIAPTPEPTPTPAPTPTLATCYESPMLAAGRESLTSRALALRQMAANGGDLDPKAVEQARARLEQDIAFFEAVGALDTLSPTAHYEAEDRLALQYRDGSLPPAPPEAVEAARVLTEILLEQR